MIADPFSVLDFNRDGRVNAVDLATVRGNLNAILAEPAFTFLDADAKVAGDLHHVGADLLA